MTTFKDKNSREWLIEIDYPTIKRVKLKTGFNLLSILDADKAEAIDQLKMLEILFSICEPQAGKESVNEDQFIAMLNTDSVMDATSAIMEGLANFSPSRLRPSIHKAIQKQEAVQAALLIEANKKMDEKSVESIVKEIMEEADAREKALKTLRTNFIGADMNTPPSSESIPVAAAPSAS